MTLFAPPVLAPTAPAIPRAIWMPGTTLPDCYQGSPIEMVQAMAEQMKPGLSTDETIDMLTRIIADYRGVRIEIGEGPEELRAFGFITALLMSGVAQPMAES